MTWSNRFAPSPGRRWGTLAIALLAIVVTSCQAPFSPDLDPGPSRSAFAPPPLHDYPWARIVTPAVWNGDLVLLASGYTFPDALIPDSFGEINPDDFREAMAAYLADMGFAVAWAEYEEPGYAVAKAYARTQVLPDYVTSRFAAPDRVFVIGGSMGSLIAVMMAEDAPVTVDLDGNPLPSPMHVVNDVAGALAFDGLVGGAKMQMEYLGHVRVLFEAYFPRVVQYPILEFPNVYEDPSAALVFDEPGGLFDRIEAWTLINSIFPNRVREFVGLNPPLVPVKMDATVALGDFQVPEPVAGVLLPLGYSLLGVTDLIERCGLTPDFNPDGDRATDTVFNNARTWYRGSSADWLLNLRVERFEFAPAALDYLRANYEPTGDPGTTNVVTLHASRDTVVPIAHEAEYQARVTAAGRASQLVQITRDVFGHGVFISEPPFTDLTDAFATLLAMPVPSE